MFTPKFIGVGGIFFKAKKPSRLHEWYRKHLSFNLNPEGNAIELWEANDDFFSDLMGPTNK